MQKIIMTIVYRKRTATLVYVARFYRIRKDKANERKVAKTRHKKFVSTKGKRLGIKSGIEQSKANEICFGQNRPGLVRYNEYHHVHLHPGCPIPTKTDVGNCAFSLGNYCLRKLRTRSSRLPLQPQTLKVLVILMALE
jgi:hypothetical protein